MKKEIKKKIKEDFKKISKQELENHLIVLYTTMLELDLSYRENHGLNLASYPAHSILAVREKAMAGNKKIRRIINKAISFW